MNILFMGTPMFAKVVMEKILGDKYFKIVGLFTQPDKPHGRKQELKVPATKEFLEKNFPHIPIFQPFVLDEISVDIVKSFKPEIVLVVAYGKILPQEILSLAQCINIHASILPKYRGASPIQEMILNDEKIYGVTAMDMEKGLDNGKILGISAFQVEKPKDIKELNDTLSTMGAKLAQKVLKNLEKISPIEQRESDSSYCKKIRKEEGMIIFDNAKSIYLKSLAYALWPHIFTKNGLKLFGIHLVDEKSENIEGKILSTQNDGSILVGCLKGVLSIKELQAFGRQKIPANAYINGKRLMVGDILI